MEPSARRALAPRAQPPRANAQDAMLSMFQADVPSDVSSVLADTTALAIFAAGVLLFGFIWCRIFAKAGYHAATGLVMLVPGLNVLALLMLAFGRWPAEKELRSLRSMQRAVSKADLRHTKHHSRAA